MIPGMFPDGLLGEVQSDPLAPIIARLDAIEARQGAAGMHDPDCAAHVLASSVNLAEIVDSSPRAVELRCTCWLSREGA